MYEIEETKHYKYIRHEDRVEIWPIDKNVEVDPPLIRQPYTDWLMLKNTFLDPHLAWLDKCKDELLAQEASN